jgi:glycosyltransferase involved in cell wall biosynthesis
VKLVQLTPGAGAMYCGNCFRDNTLVTALRRQGHDTLMVPLYLPLTLDELPTASTPPLFGGINVYLDQLIPLHRRLPGWFRRLFDAPALLRLASARAAKTKAEDVGELTLSMLRGEEGNQARDLEELIQWLGQQPASDAIFLSNALLVGLARQLRQRLKARVIVFLQSEETFLDSIPGEVGRACWETLAQRAGDVDGWIAPTRYFAERMTQRLPLPPERVRVVPNGISLDGYDRLPPRFAKRPGDPLTLGFFARMCPEKGLDLVVDAFIELRRRGRLPQLRLKVGGGCGPTDEPYVVEQRDKLARAGLAREATFHPNVSREEKVPFYAECDVLSVPARISESFGLYQIEALAAGTPLVQPDRAGFAEILGGTGGGVVCGPNTVQALVGALEPLLLDPGQLHDLGTVGRDRVFKHHTDATMAAEIVQATESLCR